MQLQSISENAGWSSTFPKALCCPACNAFLALLTEISTEIPVDSVPVEFGCRNLIPAKAFAEPNTHGRPSAVLLIYTIVSSPAVCFYRSASH
jgi:hypothetical protein